MTDFLKIAKSIVVHFAHICAYGVETVKPGSQYVASRRVIHLKPVQNRSQLSRTHLHPVA